MNVSAASLAPDSSVRKAAPSDNTERTARSGAVVETIFLSRPLRAQCNTAAETAFLRTELEELQKLGAVDKSHRPYCVLPIKCIPKKFGDSSKYRLITDLRLVNGFVQAPAFQQESVHSLSQFMYSKDALVTFDIKNRFFFIFL